MTTLILSRRNLLLSALASLGMSPARAAGAGDVAIVVRPETPVDNLSLGDLRRVLLGDRQFWSSNLRVTLLVRAPGAHEREVVLNTVYQMSEAQYRQYWIAKVFRAEAASAPRIVYSSEMAVELAEQQFAQAMSAKGGFGFAKLITAGLERGAAKAAKSGSPTSDQATPTNTDSQQ